MSGAPARTVLNEWHRAHGARMVAFGGWDMPLQYASGIIGEHLATRRRAGLFDVSHMGRFELSGPAAEAFLASALTNDARTLAPGEAHYTMIASEAGGAVDDAYLYRLGADRFLLVVNASNRAKDWEWLHGLDRAADPGLALEDVSEPLAMIALQGPAASTILEALVPAASLPEARRNRLATLDVGGEPVVIARTGYTGETTCFELFPSREIAVDLWSRLAAAGAAPAGLGARDSLRLEAGLPLYGHELGLDEEGREIPIFAIPLARYAVRRPGGDAAIRYVGQAALERQRAELARIRAGDFALPLAERALPRTVRPLAVLEGRRPLRAGHRALLEGRPVGYLTSGTAVPVAAGDGHELRSIGLALLDSDLGYAAEPPVDLDIVDERGRTQPARIVGAHR